MSKTFKLALASMFVAAMSVATMASASAPASSFPRNLAMGATGSDVKELQQFLNACPDTALAVAAGATGSAGNESMTYGPATMNAVMAYQAKVGVSAVGAFGPMTRAQAAALGNVCGAVVPPVVTPPAEALCPNGMTLASNCMTAPVVNPVTPPVTPPVVGLTGEASLDDITVDSASDDELEEGAEDAEVAEITFEFKDGDAQITRMDISILDQDASTDTWDVLDTVALMVDGKEVASMDASNEDDYQDEDTGTLRFTGLSIVAEEDEELEVSVVVTLQDNIDSGDLDTYDVDFTSFRWQDAEGVVETEVVTENAVTFDITAAGAEDEIIAKTSTGDPDGTTLQVKGDAKSDWYKVFEFDLDTDDSTNDIELNTIKVNFITNGTTPADAGYDDLVDDVELVIDGTVIDDVVVSGTTASEGTAVLTFDVDGDVTIDAGDRVKVELKARFKTLIPTEEGATVQGSISSLTTSIIDAEGAENIGNSQLSGSATGDVHTLRTAGINVSFTSSDADVTTQDGATNDYATYEMKVKVTAFEQDVYISTAAATSIAYTLEDSSAVAAPAGTRTPTLSSTADEQGGYFLVNEGDTETFTFTVTYVPGAANEANRMQLDTISFAPTAVAPTQTWTASPETTYRTAVVTVVN